MCHLQEWKVKGKAPISNCEPADVASCRQRMHPRLVEQMQLLLGKHFLQLPIKDLYSSGEMYSVTYVDLVFHHDICLPVNTAAGLGAAALPDST